jgi:hypothetical protein
MPTTLTKNEIVDRGREIYDRNIRPIGEAGNKGRFVVVDVLTGAFEIADTDRAASDLLRARAPEAVMYGVRVGYPTAYRMGGSSRVRPT